MGGSLETVGALLGGCEAADDQKMKMLQKKRGIIFRFFLIFLNAVKYNFIQFMLSRLELL